MKVILVCGYRRTGKDSLCNILAGVDMPGRFRWRVYKHPSEINKSLNIGSCYFMRVAFADALKAEAAAVYGIPPFVSDDDKDIKQFVHYNTGADVSARDIYIEWGSIRRQQDPEYWCKIALSMDRDSGCIVTDWRFRNESRYALENFADTITIRVYRSDVPEPDMSIDSEHDLDAYRCDMLLLRDDMAGEFEIACKRFPQYHDYVACEII